MLLRPLASVWRRCGCSVLALLVLLLGWPPHALATSWAGVPVTAAAPTVTLDPSSGPCATASTMVTVRGSGFAPGVAVNFLIRRDRDGAFTGGNSVAGGPPANADGTFVRTIPLIGCGPDEPAGSTFTVIMYEYRPDRTPSRGPEASATFTVTAPASSYPSLPNTGGGGTAQGGDKPWLGIVGFLLLAALWGPRCRPLLRR